jgi:arylsulfatase A-like enzyme
VSLLDVAPTLLDSAGVEPAERLDGRSLVPLLKGQAPETDRELLFECGWHVGVNFACAIQRWDPKTGHHLYTYNCSSDMDELYDLRSTDAENLAQKPEHAPLHREMIQRMGAFLERDPRWIGYWHSFGVDHFHHLPRRETRDVQMFRPI